MKNYKRFCSILLALIGVVCLIAAGILIVQYLVEDQHITTPSDKSPITTEKQEIIVSPIPIATPQPTESVEVTPAPTATPVPTATPIPAVSNPYADSYLANSDMAGWLVVPGTVIDYPIMWTPEDENYYLHRGFNKKKNSNGSLILDTDSCLNPLTTNLIIHGHNMKSGAMFGDLTEYENWDYYQDHKQIILHTKECQRNYEVIAVFYSQVYKKTDTVFKFYKFFQANTEEEFNDFYENIMKLSIYDTGVTAEFGDNFITLSTCAYHVTNGRFVVVAKEVEPGVSYLPVEESISQ